MTNYFDIQHTVTESEIDAQRHVHNLQYLQWTLWAARDHSASLGWDAEYQLRENNIGWVVRSHEITYRMAALAGDQLVIRTWVSALQPFASTRKCVIYRPADRGILARAETRWVFVDLAKHKALAIPDVINDKMTVAERTPPPPWSA